MASKIKYGYLFRFLRLTINKNPCSIDGLGLLFDEHSYFIYRLSEGPKRRSLFLYGGNCSQVISFTITI